MKSSGSSIVTNGRRGNAVRRNLRRVLLGGSLIIFLSPAECVDWYCDRHSDEPPICNQFTVD